MADATTWPIDTELWHYETIGERYAPMLLGRVVHVGALGVTVRLAKPDRFGDWEMRLTFDCPEIWTTEAEARAWCTQHIGPWEHLKRE